MKKIKLPNLIKDDKSKDIDEWLFNSQNSLKEMGYNKHIQNLKKEDFGYFKSFYFKDKLRYQIGILFYDYRKYNENNRISIQYELISDYFYSSIWKDIDIKEVEEIFEKIYSTYTGFEFLKTLEEVELQNEINLNNEVKISNFVKKLINNQETVSNQIERFHTKYNHRFEEIVDKIINKYSSDKYYKRYKGDSPQKLFDFLYEYSKIYGRKCDDDEYETYGSEFTADLRFINGYYISLICGQGSFIKIIKK